MPSGAGERHGTIVLATLAQALRPVMVAGSPDGVSTTLITTFRARADRIIAAGRFLLAAGGFLAIWLDPTQPRRYQTFAYGLLGSYTLYALLVLLRIWRSDSPHVRGTLRRHAGDLLVFAVIMYLTNGPTSPFFVFLAFAILAGTLHWQWRGALFTALACVLILVCLGVLDVLDTTDSGFGLKTVAMRLVYLGVGATLLVWLGAHQEQVRAELWRLAERAPVAPDGTGWPVAAALGYAAGALRVPRVLLVWADAEEPWTCLTLWDRGRVQEERVSPEHFAPWVTEAAARVGIVTNRAVDGSALLHLGRGRFEDWPAERGPLIHPDLVARFAMRSLVTVPVWTRDLEARLFLLDVPNASFDDLPAVEIVAGRIKALFEQESLLRELRGTAALTERVRIARDLHDGVLQALAGTALQLRSLVPLVESSPQEAAARLASLQEALAAEQREVRSFIRALGPEPDTAAPAELGLATRLANLAERLRRQWSIEVRCEVTPAEARLSPGLAGDVGWIVAEATANAARHGGAGIVEARVRVGGEVCTVDLADDGHGFPFDGELGHAELAARGLGPGSLRERAVARGGRLTVASGPDGARISVALPLAPGTQA